MKIRGLPYDKVQINGSADCSSSQKGKNVDGSTPYVIETSGLHKTYKNIQALKPLGLKVASERSLYGDLSHPVNSIIWHCILTPMAKVGKQSIGSARPAGCSGEERQRAPYDAAS